MAIALNGNTFYISDGSTSQANTPGSFLDDKDISVVSIIASGTASAGDAGEVTLNDIQVVNGAVVAGPPKFTISCGAGITTNIRLPGENAARFPNGVWVSANSNIDVTLIIKRKNG